MISYQEIVSGNPIHFMIIEGSKGWLVIIEDLSKITES